MHDRERVFVTVSFNLMSCTAAFDQPYNLNTINQITQLLPAFAEVVCPVTHPVACEGIREIPGNLTRNQIGNNETSDRLLKTNPFFVGVSLVTKACQLKVNGHVR